MKRETGPGPAGPRPVRTKWIEKGKEGKRGYQGWGWWWNCTQYIMRSPISLTEGITFNGKKFDKR